jgi:hypothetical protein
MDWNKIFEYRDGNIYWKIEPSNRHFLGKEAGHNNGFNYKRFRYQKISYMVHNIIWNMFNGEIPEGYEIDHKDRNGMNNEISNLRLATSSQNKYNRGINKNNSSGVTGVTWDSARSLWAAQMESNGKHILLGRFENLSDAVLARRNAEKEFYGEFANA